MYTWVNILCAGTNAFFYSGYKKENHAFRIILENHPGQKMHQPKHSSKL